MLMLHADINKSHVNMLLLQVDITYLACKVQTFATIENKHMDTTNSIRPKHIATLSFNVDQLAMKRIRKCFQNQFIPTILLQENIVFLEMSKTANCVSTCLIYKVVKYASIALCFDVGDVPWQRDFKRKHPLSGKVIYNNSKLTMC